MVIEKERADTESYDYFYVEAEEGFTFFRFPKPLISERRFKSLSTDAKVLYGLIERRKQGFCKPARIFVKDFTHSRKQKHPIMPDADEGVTKDGKRAWWVYQC